MQKEEFISKINNIINANLTCGIEIYACLKVDEGFEIEKMVAMDLVKRAAKDLLIKAIKKQYMADEIEYDDVLNISDNKKSVYLLEQDTSYCPFINLEQKVEKCIGFCDERLDQVIGFMFKFNMNSKKIFAYQNAYSGTKIRADRGLRIIQNRGEDRFEIFKKNLIRFDERLEFLIIERTILIRNIAVLQSNFKFDRYIRTAAKNTLLIIENLEIVSDIEKIKECEGDESLIYSKKLMKINNSPVLKMDRQVLLEKLPRIPRYASIIKIEEGKIKTSTKKDVQNLLKMLNDDYVKSLLTDQEYDSPSKVILAK